jgi:molybdate transport system ATP-binding protein
MQIKNLHLENLQIDELTTLPGESWCLYGENQSGIDDLIELLSAKGNKGTAEILEFPGQRGVLSFQVQQEIFEQELRNDDTDYLDRLDPGTLVCEFVPDYAAHLSLFKAFGMDQCLHVGYRQLSSGQCRKLILLRALTGGAKSLIIQNPYDGIDEKSCLELDQALCRLPKRGIDLIVTASSVNDIPAWCSHLGIFRSGRLELAGTRKEVFPTLLAERERGGEGIGEIEKIYCRRGAKPENRGAELVFLQDGFAGYAGKKLFSGLNLIIRTGDHTLVTGPNGCGKSTLLDIITGDNPKCYSNNLRIFDRRRGTGESIWDIKRQMGMISPSLHRDHHIPGSALHIVLSGLYDSIGLYKKVREPEIRLGLHWLDWIGLRAKADISFRKLPFAQQRLVLIARALIKSPKLLIFDEPTQGLDDVHRHALLDLLERIAEQRLSTILFVSHRRDEQRSFFKQRIRLDSYAG